MSSIKLHEATKKFKISNKLAMFFLEKMKLAVKSHSSVLSVDQLELLREFVDEPKKYATILSEFERLEKGKKPSPATAAKKEPEKKKAAEKIEKPPREEKAEKTKVTKPPAKGKEVKPKEKAKEEKAPREARGPKEITIEKPVAAPPTPPPRPEVKIEEKKKEIKEKVKEPPPPVPEKKIVPPVKPKIPEFRPPPKPPAARPVIIGRPKPSEQRGYRTRPTPPPVRRPAPPVLVKKIEPEIKLPAAIQISDFITPKELAEKLGVKLKYVEDRMAALKMGYLGSELMEPADALALCQELKVTPEVIPYESYIFQNDIQRRQAKPTPRIPVVTVMGHVDHGKTTLLDTLRRTRIAEKEAGGITQKIGATKLKTKEGEYIFIDTPGHEAFTNLRARGAKVTDIVILVVAANDGVQPQTVEAIHHAQAANVPLIVAINKIDLPGANIDRIKQDLSKHDVLVEEWGGKVVSVGISAKLNQNLDTLLEMVHLLAEMQELKAYAGIPARGTIIEARLDPQLGPIGTLLVQHGRLKRGDPFICGNSLGKVKAIFDDTGKTLDEAGVSDPVEIMGFEAIPEAGDTFQIIADVDKAQKVIEKRRQSQKDARSRDVMAEKKLSLQDLFQKIEQDKIQTFPMIIKADSFGSGEVVEQILLKKNQEKLKIDIIHKGIGNITEGDILLASTSRAIILGFNVKTPQKVLELAKREGVEIKLYAVIYHLAEDIEKAIQGRLEPEYEEVLIGKAEVLQKFKVSKVGYVAGCLIREGKVTNKSKIKVLRDGNLLFSGDIESLKRIKDDVSEVRAGTECGIRIRNFNDFEAGDTLEIFESVVKA